MSEPTTASLGQLDCRIYRSGKFKAFAMVSPSMTLLLEGRIPATVARDAATQEAVRALARTVMERMVALLVPATEGKLTITASRKEEIGS